MKHCPARNAFPQVREHLDARLDESIAQIERGEGIPADRLLEALAERRHHTLASENGLQRNEQAINERLDKSFALAERDYPHTLEEARALFKQDANRE